MREGLTPEELRRDPKLFIELMEKYKITLRQLGISPNYKAKIKSGLKKPSLDLCRRLLELIGIENREGWVAARSQLGGAAEPLGLHSYPQRGRLNFRVRYESGCCPAAMAGSGRRSSTYY